MERRKFDAEFKEGAVRVVRETGKPIAQVARELRINVGTLGNWVGMDRRRRESGDGVLSESQRAEHGIAQATACRALGVSESWFYKWRGGLLAAAARHDAVAAAVRFVFVKHKGRYGSPRITAELRTASWRVSENTVAELMREQHLVARRRRRRRGWTKSSASARKAPDLLGRDFSLRDGPDKAWVGDLTEIPNDQGPLFLATILDLHSRRGVGL